MKLNTTTHQERNPDVLKAFVASVPPNPTILQVGAGVSARGFGRITQKGTWTRPFSKPLETLLRKLPLPDIFFENYESKELLDLLIQRETQFDLIVCDINPRALRIIQQSIGVTPFPVSFKTQDITQWQPENQYDGAVCINVFCRIAAEKRNQSVANIVSSLPVNGVLAVDPNEEKFLANQPLQKIEPGVFQKTQ